MMSSQKSPLRSKGRISILQRSAQTSYAIRLLLFVVTLPCCVSAWSVDDQSTLEMTINEPSDRMLTFDWPTIKIGTASYEDGPTGVTVIEFAKRSKVAIDVRGGASGTINAAFLDNMYNLAELDAIVLSGGSWYGLETATAVATAMKDDGVRDGSAFSGKPNIAMVLGSIIYDYGDRRLNEIYPDKRLAQAAYRNTEPGIFPMGAYGGGRNTRSGEYFECNAASGQGAAFRQIGKLKLAAFTVVNPFGAVVDRDGNVAACHPKTGQKVPLKISKLWAEFPNNRENDWSGLGDKTKNTTISVLVVNQKLDPALLKRLAVQVHTSMARGIQPFSTAFDGDVLYAVSTNEVEEKLDAVDIGSVASELMWDAVLTSVPKQNQYLVEQSGYSVDAAGLDGLTGTYYFSRFTEVIVSRKRGKLFAQVTDGSRSAFGIGKDKPTLLVPISADVFSVPGRYPVTLKFDRANNTLTFNPGRWQQLGTKLGAEKSANE